MIPGAEESWTAAGVDEFLRSFLEPRGEPHGPDGFFWTRLRALDADSLFVRGRRDRLVPIAFASHVRRALPPRWRRSSRPEV